MKPDFKRYTELFRHYHKLGISLDLSRVNFDNSVFEALAPLHEKMFTEMAAVERGDKVNSDEDRMVGHYWLREPSLSPTQEIRNAIESEIGKIKKFAADIHSGAVKPPGAARFSQLVIIGIGGSALGPQLMSDALTPRSGKMTPYFCDNTDRDGIVRILENLGDKVKEALFIVISKSGGTVETRNGASEFELALKSRGLNFAKQAVAITCAGSKLDKQAESNGWITRIHIWDWVGGRTSIFSAVGLVPAVLQGFDIDAFLEGARTMDHITRESDANHNPAALLASMWHILGEGRGKKDMVVLPYKDRLVLFSKYLQQLIMESIGKERDRDGKVVNQGIAVYGNKGSTDQHAYVQQLRDGVHNFFVTFIQVEKDLCFDYAAASSPPDMDPGITSGDYLTGFYLGTRDALSENERQSISISVRELSARTLGALIALFERAVGFYATMVNINAYHQPGVEAGKKAATAVVELKRGVISLLKDFTTSSSALSAVDVATRLGEPEKVETVFQILSYLSANDWSGVQFTGALVPAEARFFLKA
jgi:glucose-6-phosphate isomerase